MSDEIKVTDLEAIENESLNKDSFSKFVIDALTNEIPQTTKIDIPKETPANEKIDTFNKNAENAIVDAYIKGENLRLDRQKPIIVFISVMLIVQLLAFNTLIFILVFSSFSIVAKQTTLFVELLDFLKYYIGAVVVELIGIMVIITKNTFSLHLGKSIEKIMSSKKASNKKS